MLSPLIGIIASSGGAAAAASSYESIATTTVGAGGASSVTFSSIPSTYTHLQIRLMAKDDDTGATPNNLRVRFNSDTATTYSRHALYGDGASVVANGNANYGYVDLIAGISTSATGKTSMFGTGIIDILDYANTNKYKTVRSLSGTDWNGSGRISLNSGNWRSTSAITSIELYSAGVNLVQYSSFALYGIKGA
jgi:hypothetical protein